MSAKMIMGRTEFDPMHPDLIKNAESTKDLTPEQAMLRVFEDFDVPEAHDALHFLMGYVGGLAGRLPLPPPPGFAEANGELGEDLVAGAKFASECLAGTRPYPAFHNPSVTGAVMMAVIGIAGPKEVKMLFHDAAIEAGKHSCRKTVEEGLALGTLPGEEEEDFRFPQKPAKA